MEIINGSILQSHDKYIFNPLNAICRQQGGISHFIVDRFPHCASILINRSHPKWAMTPAGINIPGSITVCGNGSASQRYIINAVIQHSPGSPVDLYSVKDGKQARERAFYSCLTKIAAIPLLHSVGFPYIPGCGVSGGDDRTYLRMLQSFEDAVRTTGTTIRLYREVQGSKTNAGYISA